MRKILTIIAVLLSASSIAQSNDQIQNKNGVDIMPVEGEFGIGVNAVPIFNFVGDIFGYTGSNNALSGNKFTSYFASNTLFGKYMLTNDNAVRAHFRFGNSSGNFSNEVFDDTQNHPDSLVEDTYKYSSTVFNIGLGYEWRRGKTRLKGVYGGEVMYQHQGSFSQEYTYGNTFGNGNASPTSTDWSSGGTVLSENPLAERMVNRVSGKFNGFGVRAFAGIEYFIAPKICFGTEFGWGLLAGFNGESTNATEFWDPTGNGTGAISENEIIGAKSRTFVLDTDNFNGSIYFMFYF